MLSTPFLPLRNRSAMIRIGKTGQLRRIAFMTRWMYPGGVETYMLRLGNYLQQHGCNVDVVTTVEPGPWFDKISEMKLGAYNWAPRGVFRGRYRMHAAHIGLRLALRRYDAVFLNHELYAQHSLCLLPGRSVAVSVLHNNHEQIYGVAEENSDLWNVAVAVSKKVEETFRHRVPSRPVIYIPYGVPNPKPVELARRRPHGLPFRLVFIGRIFEAKGVLLLPELVRKCLARGLDVKLTLAGSGPDREAVEVLSERFGIADRLEFLGTISPEAVYPLLLDSHVNLLPSFYEGFPLVPLEAQACGCVPVATRMPGITDISIQEGRTGLLCGAGDVDGFVDAVSELCRNRTQWTQMSLRGRGYVAESFSVDGMGEAYLKLITDSVGQMYNLPRSRWKAFPRSLFSPVILP